MGAYGGKELAEAFRTVRKNTIQIAEDIPESKYDFVAAPGCKTVGAMLAHIGVTTGLLGQLHREKRVTTMVGVNFLEIRDRIIAEESKKRTKAEIVDLLRKQAEDVAAWLETLTPEFLNEGVTQPDGKTKTRLEHLLGAREHEMHHRAQLMLIERQLGIVPHLTRQFQERLAQMQAAKA